MKERLVGRHHRSSRQRAKLLWRCMMALGYCVLFTYSYCEIIYKALLRPQTPMFERVFFVCAIIVMILWIRSRQRSRVRVQEDDSTDGYGTTGRNGYSGE